MSCSDAGSESGWSEVAKDLLRESQEESEETELCDACKSDTSGVASAEGHGSSVDDNHDQTDDQKNSHRQLGSRAWWAELIKSHTQEFLTSDVGTPGVPKNVTVASACSGIFAEGEALKAQLVTGWDWACHHSLPVPDFRLK